MRRGDNGVDPVAELAAFPTLAVAADDGDIAYRSFHFIYGLSALPVTW